MLRSQRKSPIDLRERTPPRSVPVSQVKPAVAGTQGRKTDMGSLSRRSVLRHSLAAADAGSLPRPYRANAAATTAEVWWTQGFIQEEDVSIKKIVADYQKASGNTIELSIMPFAPARQKIVSAVTSGVVPDLFPNNPGEIV